MNDNLSRLAASFLIEYDAKEERRKLRPWIGAVLAGMCLALLFVFAKQAYGAEPTRTAQFQQLSLFLYDRPCENKIILAMLEERVHKTYKAGLASHKKFGQREFCYLELPQYPNIFILDEAGEQADLPKDLFNKSLGV